VLRPVWLSYVSSSSGSTLVFLRMDFSRNIEMDFDSSHFSDLLRDSTLFLKDVYFGVSTIDTLTTAVQTTTYSHVPYCSESHVSGG
jgi:hypothetical protein